MALHRTQVKRSLFLALMVCGLPLRALPARQSTRYTVTAYCHCARCCGRANQPTGSGRTPLAGLTVAGPRSVPYGTRVFIEGIGIRTVQDRLAGRFEDRFDVYVGTHHAAQKFGLRHLQVTVLP